MANPIKCKTIKVEERDSFLILTLNVPEKHNAMNQLMLDECHQVLEIIEKKAAIRLLVIQAEGEIFCSGMDLNEIKQIDDPIKIADWTADFSSLLKRMTLLPCFVLTHVNAKAIAGGVGLVAASDWVIGSKQASFKLSEALWGLLPAMIAPYLIKRMGFQSAYAMALTCRTVSASEAMQMHLIDELTEDFDEALQRMLHRAKKIERSSIIKIKNYFRKLSNLNEQNESLAIEEITKCLLDPNVRKHFFS